MRYVISFRPSVFQTEHTAPFSMGHGPVQNLNERKANYTFGKIVPKNLFIYSAQAGDYAHRSKIPMICLLETNHIN